MLRSSTAWAGLALALGLVLAVRPMRAEPKPSGALAGRTLELVNELRSEVDVAPLAASAALDAAALAKAKAIAAEAATVASSDPNRVVSITQLGDMPDFLAEVDYDARAVKAHVVVGDRELSPRALLDSSRSLRDDLLDGRFRHLGLALARQGALEIVVLIPALSKEDDFAERTRGLEDRDQIRRDLLRLTNEARQGARRGPLRPDRCLEGVAQRYAERMLAEGFYGHVAPDGGEAVGRVNTAGCANRRMAENLARGQTSPEQVIAGWLDSPGHRENLLGRVYDRVGFGFAVGRSDGEYWVIWVQVLAAR